MHYLCWSIIHSIIRSTGCQTRLYVSGMKQNFTIALAMMLCVVCLGRAENGLPDPVIGVYPQLEDTASFSMILVPDPQSYTKFAANQPLFDLQTAWIAQNQHRLNIKSALFTGDMVEQGNKLVSTGLPHPLNGDQTSRQQWEAVGRALARLDGRLPYIVCQGNHDVGYLAAENRFSMQPDYIYPERNPMWATCMVATAPDHRGIHTMENAAFEFTDPHWGPLLVVAFEFAPRDETLEWAAGLISSERFRNHRVIVLTHSFLNTKGNVIQSERYELTPRNWPAQVWDKLIAPSRNIAMVLCGHAGTPPHFPDEADTPDDVDYTSNSAFRIEKAADGRPVPIMMFNSQTGDGEWFGNGGDCWLRILEFKPDGRTVGVRTFSPLFAQSKLTRSIAWRAAPCDCFSFEVSPLKPLK